MQQAMVRGTNEIAFNGFGNLVYGPLTNPKH